VKFFHFKFKKKLKKYIFGSDQTTGCPGNHMKTFSNIDGSHCIFLDVFVVQGAEFVCFKTNKP
jgi:hypothetical protein